MKHVLFFSCTIQGLKKLAPVIRTFERKGDIAVNTVIVGWREREFCQENHLSYHMVDEYSDFRRLDDWDTELAIDAVTRLLAQERPDLLITIDSGGFMESMFRACRRQGIPTIALQHSPLMHRIHDVPLEADLYLYWGDFFARQLHEMFGVPEQKSAVAGSAQFDATLTGKSDRAELAKRAGLETSKKWYVFCGQTWANVALHFAPEKAVAAAAETVCGQKEAQFVYRPHPDETEEKLDILRELVPGVRIVRNVDTVDLLRESAGAMTFYSTVAIDAALLGKPLLLFNRPDLKHAVLPLYDMGAALCCDNEEELELSVGQLLRTSISDETRRRVIQELNGGSTGQAVERITAACLKML